MRRIDPLVSRLALQIGAAALVSAAAIGALASLARPTNPTTTAAVVPTAVQAEAVFTAKPRLAPVAESLDEDAAPKPGGLPGASPRAKAKPASQPRKLAAAEPLPAPPPAAPLAIVPAEPAPIPAPPAADTGVLGTLRGMTATVTAMPQRAYSRMSSWFTADAEPPRPSVDVPVRDFAKAM